MFLLEVTINAYQRQHGQMAGVWSRRMTQGQQHNTGAADSLASPAVGGGIEGGQTNVSLGGGKMN